jgi:alginate O-acetyltransferase complex protein AlgI
LSGERIAWTLIRPRGRRNPLRRSTVSLASAAGALQRLFVFHFVCVSWVLFRSRTLTEAISMFVGAKTWVWRPEYAVAFGFLATVVAAILAIDLLNEIRGEEYPFAGASLSARVAAGVAGVSVLAIFGANELNAFIYFQF